MDRPIDHGGDRGGHASDPGLVDARPGRTRAAFGALGSALAEERERWALWIPVGLGLGVGLYFALPAEPAGWLGGGATFVTLVAAIVLRARLIPLLAALAALTIALGFAATQLRTAMVAAPALQKRIGPATVSGRIVSIERLQTGRRLVLDGLSISRLGRDRTPARIRVVDRKGLPALKPGDRVRLRAVLLPPPRPIAPGAFDFARRDFFRRIGAVGYVVAAPEREPRKAAGKGGFALALARLRQTVARRVAASLDGAAGGVAAALLTGDRGGIPKETLAALRDSGLAHLLAISGLHLSLVALILFFGIRAGLALVEPVALRRPIKKWAAVAALIGAFGYLLITGATVPTQRAFIMLAIVLLGVMVDRVAISMRLVAWAAVVVLLIAPESLLSVSFQMSFAAVVALVAVYEALRERAPGWRNDPRWWRRIALYVAAVALTTLVAGAATGPFAVFHFNRLAAFGIAANLVAVPVTAFWIMPWGLVAFLLMPFGLEQLALVPMGWGLDVVIGVAETVAGWPGAVTLLPAMPDLGLIAVALGGLWLALWRGRWRLAGAAVVLAGLATGPLAPAPDVLVSEAGRLLAVKAPDGTLVLSSRRFARFQGSAWLRQAGQGASRDWPHKLWGEKSGKRSGTRATPKPAPWLTCDGLGCIYRSSGQVVALARDERALGEDCRLATVVVSLQPLRGRCPSALRKIDRFDLWRAGTHAIYLTPKTIRIETVRDAQGERPWTRKTKSRPARRRKARRR
jgi:competence protein ComEC